MNKGAVRIGLFAVAGLIIALLVSWSSLLWPDEGTVTTSIEVPAWAPSNWPTLESSAMPVERSHLPHYSTVLVASAGTDVFVMTTFNGSVQQQWTAIRAGWPFRALACDSISDGTGSDDVVRGGIPVPAAGMILPVRPLFFGLALNAVVYSLSAWGCVRSVWYIRRLRRRRRGLCRNCGYPAADAEIRCPECGSSSK